MHIVVSDSAAARLDAARQFVLAVPPASEILIVSASRGAADDFARDWSPAAAARRSASTASA